MDISKKNVSFTKRKSSSAPLKRKITGRGGIQLESIISRAISSMEAANYLIFK